MTASLQERIAFVRARWHSLCPDYCVTEAEAQDWLARYRMNLVLHGIKIALQESTRLAHRGSAPYSEDEAVHRAEQVMRDEQEAYEVRRAQQN